MRGPLKMERFFWAKNKGEVVEVTKEKAFKLRDSPIARSVIGVWGDMDIMHFTTYHALLSFNVVDKIRELLKGEAAS